MEQITSWQDVNIRLLRKTLWSTGKSGGWIERCTGIRKETLCLSWTRGGFWDISWGGRSAGAFSANKKELQAKLSHVKSSKYMEKNILSWHDLSRRLFFFSVDIWASLLKIDCKGRCVFLHCQPSSTGLLMCVSLC